MMAGATVAAAITMVILWVALGSVPLAAWTVKLNDPEVVGVPLKVPLVVLSVTPGGTVPVAMLHIMGEVPVAVKVWL